MGILSPTRPSNNQANLTLNQSIYANTVALPKMNGGPAVRHGSNGSNGSSTKSGGGLNTSKLSSSNSPATTNQTKTSYMDSSRWAYFRMPFVLFTNFIMHLGFSCKLTWRRVSFISRDHSHHELENTQLSPIARSSSNTNNRPNGYLRTNQSVSASPPLLTTGNRFSNTSGLSTSQEQRD